MRMVVAPLGEWAHSALGGRAANVPQAMPARIRNRCTVNAA
jgi:hypothetical protein